MKTIYVLSREKSGVMMAFDSLDGAKAYAAESNHDDIELEWKDDDDHECIALDFRGIYKFMIDEIGYEESEP